MTEQYFVGNDVKIGKNVEIGDNARIMDFCELEDGAKIGLGCILYPNTKIQKNAVIQDLVIIGKQPRSLKTSTFQVKERRRTTIGEGSLVCSGCIVYAGVSIGHDNIIGDRATIREGAKTGKNVKIGKNVVIEFDASIGDNVSIQTNALIAEKSVIENEVFIGPNVCMALDKYMARKGSPLNAVTIRRGAAIGAGCLLMPGVQIGENTLVSAGSLIAHSLEPNFVYMGNPPRQMRPVRADEVKT